MTVEILFLPFFHSRLFLKHIIVSAFWLVELVSVSPNAHANSRLVFAIISYSGDDLHIFISPEGRNAPRIPPPPPIFQISGTRPPIKNVKIKRTIRSRSAESVRKWNILLLSPFYHSDIVWPAASWITGVLIYALLAFRQDFYMGAISVLVSVFLSSLFLNIWISMGWRGCASTAVKTFDNGESTTFIKPIKSVLRVSPTEKRK